jgi:hypothetical protein
VFTISRSAGTVARTATRAAAVAAMTAGLALAGGTAVPSEAHAATRTVTFSFKYRLTTQSWQQKAGTTTLTIKSCRGNETFHVQLKRSRWGTDSVVDGGTIRCRPGAKASFTAPVSGTYYFVFMKLDNGNLLSGTARIDYPS